MTRVSRISRVMLPLLAAAAVLLTSSVVLAEPRGIRVMRVAPMPVVGIGIPGTLGFAGRLAPFPNGPFVREQLYFPPSGIFFGQYPPDRIISPVNPPFFNYHLPPFRAPVSPPSVVFPPFPGPVIIANPWGGWGWW